MDIDTNEIFFTVINDGTLKIKTLNKCIFTLISDEINGVEFTTIKNIHHFCNTGTHIQIIELTDINNINTRSFYKHNFNIYVSKNVILGKLYSLTDLNTYINFKIEFTDFEYLIRNNCDDIIKYNLNSANQGVYSNVYNMKVLTEGANQRVYDYGYKLILNNKCMNDLLYAAVVNNSMYWVKYFVENGGNVPENIYIMYKLVKINNLAMLKYLVQNGIDVNYYNNYALKKSAKKGNLEFVKYFVGMGANINAEYDYALRESAGHGYLEVVKYLLDNGANINAEDD